MSDDCARLVALALPRARVVPLVAVMLVMTLALAVVPALLLAAMAGMLVALALAVVAALLAAMAVVLVVALALAVAVAVALLVAVLTAGGSTRRVMISVRGDRERTASAAGDAHDGQDRGKSCLHERQPPDMSIVLGHESSLEPIQGERVWLQPLFPKPRRNWLEFGRQLFVVPARHLTPYTNEATGS